MIRRAVPADAAAIRQVQVQSWRESHAGIVPEVMFAALDPTPTEWRRNLAGPASAFVT